MQWWCFAQILLLLNKADYQASHQTIKVSTKRWISKRLVCLTAPPGNRTTAPGYLQTGCGAESTKGATISFWYSRLCLMEAVQILSTPTTQRAWCLPTHQWINILPVPCAKFRVSFERSTMAIRTSTIPNSIYQNNSTTRQLDMPIQIFRSASTLDPPNASPSWARSALTSRVQHFRHGTHFSTLWVE